VSLIGISGLKGGPESIDPESVGRGIWPVLDGFDAEKGRRIIVKIGR
jgi:hypothetical protein